MSEEILSFTELSSFAGQMALVLKSGISALEGITIMKEDAASEKDAAIYGKIEESMLTTGYFAPALKEAGVFPPYFVNLTEIGERTGNLDSVMQALEAHYEREDSIRQSTRNAVFYPMILTAMMLVVIAVLLVRVMPVFNEVFLSLGTEMTGLPAVLLSIGDGLRRYLLIIILIVFALLLVIFVINRTNEGRGALLKLTSHFPGVRKSNHAVAACRFASAMQMTLSSGLTPDESMDLACELNEDPDFAVVLNKTKQDMENGKSFSSAVFDNKIFSGIYSRMLSIGQKTGCMDQVMGRIADMYQTEIDTRTSNRLAVIEPLLVIVMSVVIGAIMLSVMFPLLGLMSSM